ncbi:MAG: hypothetical protein HY308_02875 [Gammaproteobacteria bacterium]|nr:hypothetical protein [Gammaproteobacteria bacterium]
MIRGGGMIATGKTSFATSRAFCAKRVNLSAVAIQSVRSGSQLCKLAAVGAMLLLGGCGGGQASDGASNATPTNPSPTDPSATYILSVTTSGSGTVTSAPAGVTCGSDCSESYASNTAVTLTAAPTSGFVFSGWGGDCAGTNSSCTVTMSAARNVTASFSASTPLSIKLQIDSVSAATPVTFGHVFVKGDVTANSGLALRTVAGQLLPVQVDNKATSSGSLRYGILSAVVPASAGSAFELVATAPLGAHTPRDVAELLNSGFDAVVTLKTSGGRTLTASARTFFLRKATRWLDGPIVTEWETSGAPSDANGDDPHLAVRFNVRSYAGMTGERVDVVVENDSTKIETPRVFTTSNVTYDVDISIRGTSVYSKPALLHYRQARWRKVFTPFTDVAPRYDVAYLKKTGAVPNYDPTVTLNDKTLTSWSDHSLSIEPLTTVLINPVMGTAGGRSEIGILPGFTAAYVMSMDARARQALLAVGTLAGSFSIHFRDKNTDRPVSITTYPDLTLLGNPGDTKHPFPACSGDCTNSPSLVPETAHQPSLAYLPYLITGDRYHLDELQFWADYNAFVSNPAYRANAQGLVKWDQVRGQAWSLRTLAQVTLITPDDDPLKNYFSTILDYNLAWYRDHLVNGEFTNNLGLVANGTVFAYQNGRGFAPWMDDFFTSAANEMFAMGFDNAKPLLSFKAGSPVKRMLDMCWIGAASYSMVVRADTTSPLYQSFGDVERATFDTSAWQNADGSRYLDQPCAGQPMADWLTVHEKTKYVLGQMMGNPTDPESYTATLQAALAAAVDANVDRANDAWSRFAGRSVKANYASEPQFAMVPR